METIFDISKVSLKKVQHMPGHDGEIWSAAIMYGGKKVGSVLQQGHGGNLDMHFYTPEEREFLAAMESYAAALPAETQKFEIEKGKPYTIQPDAEWLFEKMFGDYVEAKEFRRKAKTNIIYLNKADGKTYFAKFGKGFKYDPAKAEEYKGIIEKEWGGTVDILNGKYLG